MMYMECMCVGVCMYLCVWNVCQGEEGKPLVGVACLHDVYGMYVCGHMCVFMCVESESGGGGKAPGGRGITT